MHICSKTGLQRQDYSLTRYIIVIYNPLTKHKQNYVGLSCCTLLDSSAFVNTFPFLQTIWPRKYHVSSDECKSSTRFNELTKMKLPFKARIFVAATPESSQNSFWFKQSVSRRLIIMFIPIIICRHIPANI